MIEVGKKTKKFFFFLKESRRPHRAILNDMTLSFNSSTILTTLPSETERLTSKSICINSYCCYHQINNRNNTFICQDKNQSNDCQNILSSCQSSISNCCHINETDLQYWIYQICANNIQLNCSIQLIDMDNSTTIKSVINTTSISTTLPLTSNKHNINCFKENELSSFSRFYHKCNHYWL